MAAEPGCALVVMTKTPRPGYVNTRLIPTLGEQGAADLYLGLLRRTLATAAESEVGAIELHCHPTTGHPRLQELSDAYPLSLYRQQGDDLGQRMDRALASALARHDCAMVIGCDAPELSAADLRNARDRLCRGWDAVLGPAEDGGYYLLGLNRPQPELFSDLPWGGGRVLELTRARLRRLGLRCFELPVHWDVDRPGDVERLRRLTGVRINLVDKA